MDPLKLFIRTIQYLICFHAVAPVEAGCSSDDECSSFQACVSRSCINPCATNNPCSPSAICYVKNHRATCTCPPGTTGDPFSSCSKSKNLVAVFLQLYFNLLEILWFLIESVPLFLQLKLASVIVMLSALTTGPVSNISALTRVPMGYLVVKVLSALP